MPRRCLRLVRGGEGQREGKEDEGRGRHECWGIGNSRGGGKGNEGSLGEEGRVEEIKGGGKMKAGEGKRTGCGSHFVICQLRYTFNYLNMIYSIPFPESQMIIDYC